MRVGPYWRCRCTPERTKVIMRRLIACLLWLMCSGAALAAAADVVAEYTLGEGVMARLDRSGELTLGVAAEQQLEFIMTGRRHLASSAGP